jgi:hypothetical protein
VLKRSASSRFIVASKVREKALPRLYLKENGSFIGTIDESELKVLIDQLEEEDESDDDYFIDEPTIELLQENGASEALVSMLRGVLDGGEGVEIFWKK